MPPVSDLESQLLATRRELAAVRRALQERRVVRRVPHSSYDTVRALSVVLQHSIPEALLELRAERHRLTRDLSSSEQRRRALQRNYSSMRYNAWQLAQWALAKFEPPELVLDQICDETADSKTTGPGTRGGGCSEAQCQRTRRASETAVPANRGGTVLAKPRSASEPAVLVKPQCQRTRRASETAVPANRGGTVLAKPRSASEPRRHRANPRRHSASEPAAAQCPRNRESTAVLHMAQVGS
jgi:hypothetical protein